MTLGAWVLDLALAVIGVELLVVFAARSWLAERGLRPRDLVGQLLAGAFFLSAA